MSNSDYHRKLVGLLRQNGYEVARNKGGHSVFKKPDSPMVVVPHAIANRNLAKRIAGQAGVELRL
jgi:predicted RNA binding protein YcfA (HicA-like mRNA interferase family)